MAAQMRMGTLGFAGGRGRVPIAWTLAMCLCLTAPPALAQWVGEDIGTTGGSTTGSIPGPLTIQADGADIWGNADHFHYYHRECNGEFTIIARVVSQDNTHVWAKAGLMARQEITPGSPHVMVVVTPANGVRVQWRNERDSWQCHSSPRLPGSPNSTAGPVWLRLRRVGQNFFAAWAPDTGSGPGTWSSEYAVASPWMPIATHIGLCATTHVQGTLGTVVMDNVQTTITPHTARVWYVDAATGGDPLEDGSAAHPFDTIQEGLEAASDGDTVEVAAGTYEETLYWVSKELALVGADAGTAIVDAGAAGRCLRMRYVPGGALVEGLTFTNGSAHGGGGILLEHSSPTLENCVVTGNHSSAYGGGVFINGCSSVVMCGNTFSYNDADADGGALAAHSITSLYAEDNRFTGNSATKGGALNLADSTVMLIGNTISDNTTIRDGAVSVWYCQSATFIGNTISRNVAGGYGGAMRLDFSQATMISNTISDNTASYRGGAFAFWNDAVVELSGNTFTGNYSGGRGGALSAWDTTLTLDDNVISGNISTNSGGGLYITRSTATLTANTISANTSDGHGGGVAFGGDTLATLEGNSIQRNKAASRGGGIFLRVNDSVTLIGNTVSDNEAQNRDGGGLATWDSDLVAEANWFTNNRAKAAAGLSIGLGTVKLTDNTISGNQATNGTGGVSIWACEAATLDGNTLTDNTGARGGGLTLDRSPATLTNNTISENTSSTWGGGLFVLNDATLTLTGNTICANSAPGYGGGLMVTDSTIIAKGNNISENATGADGALFIQRSTLTLENNTLEDNTTQGEGGALVISESSGTIKNNTIEFNEANYGAGGLTIKASSPTLSGNTVASNTGHGITLSGSSPTIDDNSICDNSGNGIILYVDRKSGGDPAKADLDVPSEPTITNNRIAGNGQTGIRCIDTAPTNSATLEIDNSLGTNGSYQVFQCWYGLVQVVNPDGSPAPGATVWVYDAAGGPGSDYGSPFLSGPQGYAPTTANPTDCRTWLLITEYVVNNAGQRVAYTPQRIVAVLGAATGETTHAWNGRYQTAQVQLRLNAPPVADAGPDQTVEQERPDGTDVTLDASGSYDPDDDPLTFSWAEDGTEIATGPSPTITFALGTHSLTLTVTDTHNATDTDTVVITVRDTTPPELSVPPDLTVEQQNPDGSVVDIGQATATDACDADVEITNDAPPIFPLGTTVVTWRAQDDSGNVATAKQTITVVDTTPPELSVPPDLTVEQQNPDGSVVDIGQATATDACDADVEITNDAPPIFPPGTTVVTWRAQDDSGNVATAKQTITVVDTTPPEVQSAWAEPATLWPPNHKMVEVTVNAIVTDTCDTSPIYAILSVTSNEPPNGKADGNTEPDWQITGDHTVELRAERSGHGTGRIYTITILAVDASGNIATTDVEVVVPHDRSNKNKGKG